MAAAASRRGHLQTPATLQECGDTLLHDSSRRAEIQDKISAKRWTEGQSIFGFYTEIGELLGEAEALGAPAMPAADVLGLVQDRALKKITPTGRSMYHGLYYDNLNDLSRERQKIAPDMEYIVRQIIDADASTLIALEQYPENVRDINPLAITSSYDTRASHRRHAATPAARATKSARPARAKDLRVTATAAENATTAAENATAIAGETATSHAPARRTAHVLALTRRLRKPADSGRPGSSSSTPSPRPPTTRMRANANGAARRRLSPSATLTPTRALARTSHSPSSNGVIGATPQGGSSRSRGGKTSRPRSALPSAHRTPRRRRAPTCPAQRRHPLCRPRTRARTRLTTRGAPPTQRPRPPPRP